MIEIFSHTIWRPGIDDNTWRGWLTLALYYSAGLTALIVWFGQRRRSMGTKQAEQQSTQRQEQQFPFILGILLLVLGVSSQIGLLRWFTSLGRTVAAAQGWYYDRSSTQYTMIQGMYVGSACLLLLLIWLNRRALLRHGPTLLGFVFLLGFLSVRAVSLHRVDTILYYRRLWGLPMGFVLEAGSLLFIIVALILPEFARQWVREREMGEGERVTR